MSDSAKEPPRHGAYARPAGAKAGSSADRQKKDWIGQQLRAAYDQVIAEPLPDDLVALLKQIDGGGGPQKS